MNIEDYDLLEYVRKTWGQEGKDMGRQVMFHCRLPGHGGKDSDPSFAVYKATQSWYCFGEHNSGNILGFIVEELGLKGSDRYKVARDILLNGGENQYPKIQKPYIIPENPKLDTETYHWCINYQPHEAIEAYCATRAISERAIKHFDLGMRMKGAMRFNDESGMWEHSFHDIDGRKVGFPVCRYLTIPTKRFGEIVAIAYRRDDLYANFLYDNLPEKTRFSLEKKYGDKKSAIDAIWTRFTSANGSKPNIFNSEIVGNLLENSDGRLQYIANKLPYVIIVEGQICAMSLQERGYYCIGAKPYNFIDWEKALRKVDHIFLAQDNDEQGKAFNAKFKAIFGKKSTELQYPIAIKDMNDEVRYGDLDAWLHNYGINPVGWEKIARLTSRNGFKKKPEEEIL